MTKGGQGRPIIASPVEHWRAWFYLQGPGTTQLQQSWETFEKMGLVLPDPTIFQEKLEICICPNFSMLTTNSTGKKMCRPNKNVQGLDNVYGVSAGALSGLGRDPRTGALEWEKLA